MSETKSKNVKSSDRDTKKLDHFDTVSVRKYEKIDKIGKGQYGVVYRGINRKSGEIVALKKVLMGNERNGFPLTSIREIQILRRLNHPNIVTLKEITVGEKPDSVFLVFEYCSHDFASLVDQMPEPFKPQQIKCIMLQLLSALDHLHKNFILHRDLKPANLLITSEGLLKIADFGLARIFGNPLQPYTPCVVTPGYRAPELLLGCKTYHTAIDMWATGCMLGEFFLNEPLIQGSSELDQIRLIFELLGTPKEKIWPGLRELDVSKFMLQFRECKESTLREKLGHTTTEEGLDLLQKMLLYDPCTRITAEKALLHPYFQESPKAITPYMMPKFPSRRSIQSKGKKRDISAISKVPQRVGKRQAV
mmetsp:Transcript_33325/g.46624  ORF Transcript_33325/g.46624 Transcript_33325/m.46624 type:complete len:363 (+) Transcript_33325:84-1172(+)